MPTLQDYGTMKTTKILSVCNIELNTFSQWVDVPLSGAPNLSLKLYSEQPKESISP